MLIKSIHKSIGVFQEEVVTIYPNPLMIMPPALVSSDLALTGIGYPISGRVAQHAWSSPASQVFLKLRVSIEWQSWIMPRVILRARTSKFEPRERDGKLC